MLHRAAYDALNALSRPDHRRLAHHAASAGDGPNVIVHAPRAATLAAALGAHREAAEHYRAALRWGHLMSDAGRADLLERLSYECYLTGELPEAGEARAAELALRRASGDTLRTGSALRGLSRVNWYRLRNVEAERYAREAVETLSQLPGCTELAMAYSNVAQLRMLADDTEGTQEWGNRAVELARALGDLDTEVHALNNIGTALMIAGHERGETILRESLDTALAHDQQEHVARAYTNLGATHVKHRRYPVAEEVLRAGIAFSDDRDLESWTGYMRGTLSILLLETGRWAEARSLATSVAAHPVASVSRINALMVLGRLGTRTGADPAAAAAAWEAAEPSGEAQRVLICASGMAEAAWTRNDRDDVRRRVDAVWDLATERGGPWDVGELLWWLHCAGETRSAPRPVAEPFAIMLAGDAKAAAAAWDDIGNPFWTALATSASDEPADLRVAAASLEALGATATQAAVERDLRRRGAPVPRRPRPTSRANPAGLTEREMEVLNALADGLSNAQIAGRFVLSEKTVAHHVSAVLRKLQEPSRSRAVATARQKGLIEPA
jgi:DNA-binding CsgD family transcriptional regulator/tetratricopeptide (TPR) repeat protein